MAAHIAIALTGLAILVVTVWAWRGRSETARWWVEARSMRRLVLGVAPGLGVLVACGGGLTLAENQSKPVFDAVALIVALPMLLAAVLVLAGMLGALPKWWGPKWYRDDIADEQDEPFDVA